MDLQKSRSCDFLIVFCNLFLSFENYRAKPEIKKSIKKSSISFLFVINLLNENLISYLSREITKALQKIHFQILKITHFRISTLYN